VPRNVYRQCLVSMDELAARIRPLGRLGEHLYDAIFGVFELASSVGLNLGETYILGDNPLVLLTALQSSFEANTSSSRYVLMDAPRINDDGTYSPRSGGRRIRVYTELDLRLMFDDLFTKLALHGRRRTP
jgi:purine nucleosidase